MWSLLIYTWTYQLFQVFWLLAVFFCSKNKYVQLARLHKLYALVLVRQADYTRTWGRQPSDQSVTTIRFMIELLNLLFFDCNIIFTEIKLRLGGTHNNLVLGISYNYFLHLTSHSKSYCDRFIVNQSKSNASSFRPFSSVSTNTFSKQLLQLTFTV